MDGNLPAVWVNEVRNHKMIHVMAQTYKYTGNRIKKQGEKSHAEFLKKQSNGLTVSAGKVFQDLVGRYKDESYKMHSS